MIAVFIKIPFLPLCSKFTSDAFSQGTLLKRLCSPQAETLPQRVQRFLPHRHANRLPFTSLSAPLQQGRWGRAGPTAGGAWVCGSSQQFACSPSPPRRGSAPRARGGGQEGGTCPVCPSGAGDQRASITWTEEAGQLCGTPWRAGQAPTRT